MDSVTIKYDRQKQAFEETKKINQSQQNQKWQNSLVILHKVLNNLENETLQRYNTGINRYSLQAHNQEYKKNYKTFNHKNNQNDADCRFNKFIIEPEPWFHDSQITNAKRSKNVSQTSKSFHLTLPNNIDAKKIKVKYGRSVSTVDALNVQFQRGQVEKARKFNTTTQQKLLTQNFNYTNQQKAKVSIEYLTHEKKHRKIQKILKYKAHCIDKTGLKQQKINQHSKFLMESLKNLSLDKLISNTNKQKNAPLAIQGNVKMNSFIQRQKQDQNQEQRQMKSFSCTKLQTSNQSFITSFRRPSKIKYSIKQLQPELIKIDEQKRDKHNYKISFKPRRSWIFQKKVTSVSQKNIKPNLTGENKKEINKINSVSSHFLKINKLGS